MVGTKDIDSYFFKTAVHQCNDLVVITDNKALIIYVNPAFEKHTGYKLKTIKGKNISIVKSGFHNTVFYRNLWKSLKEGKPRSTVFINKKKNGELYYENKTITPILNEKGKITHYLSTSKDVSVEHKLQKEGIRQRNFINTILQRTDALILCLDQNGRITMFNKACERLTGYSSSEVTGKSIFSLLIPKEQRVPLRKILRDVRDSGQKLSRYENHWVTKNGKCILISWSNTIINNENEALGIILLTGIDITKERKIEDELRNLNYSLDKKVKERTQKLSELSEELINNNKFIKKVNGELPAIVYMVDKEHNTIKLFNNQINREAKLPVKKGVALPLNDILKYINEDVKPNAKNLFLNSMQESVELPFVVNNKSYWVQKRSIVFKKDKQNKVKYILGFITDVSQSKSIQEKLEESQKIAHIGTWEWNIENNDLYWSDETFRIFEFNKKTFKPSYPKFLDAVYPEDKDIIVNAIKGAIESCEPYEVVHRLKPKSGKIKYVREKGHTIYSLKGSPLRMIGTVQDISKETDLELKLKTAFDTLENSLIAIFTLDISGNILSANNAGLNLFGFTDFSSIIEHTVLFNGLFNVKHKGEIRRIFESGLKNGFYYSDLPLVGIRKDGENVLVKLNLSLVRDTNGKPSAFSAALFDITKQVKIEQEIAKQERKISLLHENIDEVVFGVDIVSKDTMRANAFYLSAKSKELMGFSFEDLKKNPFIWQSSIHPDDLGSVIESNKECAISKKACTRIYRLLHHKTKEYRWFEERMTPYFDQSGVLKSFYGSARDVTKRIEDETKLKLSEERYRLLSDNNRDMITLRDSVGKAIFVSNSVKTLLGYDVEEYLTLNLFDVMHPDDRDRVRLSTFTPAFKGMHNGYTEGRIRHKDGHYLWLQVLTQPVYDEKGEVIQIVGSSRDITERKRLEEALGESEKKYRSIFNNALVAIFRINIHLQKPLDANDACIDLFGYDSMEDFLENFIASERYAVPEEREGLFKDLQVNSVVNRKVKFKRKNGTFFWGNANAKLLTEDGIMEGVIVDITENHEYEAKLQKNLQEKELLLKEVHHRVKNNLQIIISLLKLQLNNIKDEKQRVPLIESQERIHAIAMIHEKLYLSEDITRINFSDYITSLTKSVQSLQYEKGVKVTYALEEYFTDINISIPLGLICYEVIANAFKHAYKNIMVPALNIVLSKAGNNVVIEIKDNGTGFNYLELDFSITLGWKLIKNLARQIKAEIEVTSADNIGTSIKIII